MFRFILYNNNNIENSTNIHKSQLHTDSCPQDLREIAAIYE